MKSNQHSNRNGLSSDSDIDIRKAADYLLELMATQKCPCCEGKGYVKRDLSVDDKEYLAKRMSAYGYSIRRIMNILNYKAPSAIQHLLKR